MKKDRDKLTDSRSQQRAQRRKTNVVLNSLIVVVLLLIVVVSVNIFGKDDKSVADHQLDQTVAGTVKDESKEEEKKEKTENKQGKKSSNQEDSEEQNREKDENLNEKEETEEAEEMEDELVVTEDSSDPSVNKTIKNPAWEPVESSQVEPAQDYKKDTIDWNEQIQAVSYATGFDQSKGDTLERLENNGPKKSAATVVIKETNQRYRVYIEWAEGQGWKPVLVEERAK